MQGVFLMQVITKAIFLPKADLADHVAPFIATEDEIAGNMTLVINTKPENSCHINHTARNVMPTAITVTSPK